MKMADENVTRPTSTSDKPLFNRNHVLRCDNETLYDRIVVFATQLAILGYTDTALRLVGKLNTYDGYHPYRARLRPLRILWDVIGKWPEGELKRVEKAVEEGRIRAAKEKLGDGEETGKRRKLEVDDSPVTDADVKKYVDEQYKSYAMCWWYPELPYLCGEEVPPSPHDQSVKLSAKEVGENIRKLIGAVCGEEGCQRKEGNDANRVNSSTALVSALELRIKLREMDEQDDDEDMPSEEDMLKMIAKDLNGHSQIEAMMQSRRAWHLLTDGALLKLLKLDKLELDRFASQLEAAMTERMDKGRQSPPARPMKHVLEAINTNTRTHPSSIELHEEMDEPIPSTILHPPAPESSISATESRLATSLPASYASYLRISNGNDAAFGGIINEAPLWACEDIRWLRDDEEYFADLHVDIPTNMAPILDEVYGCVDNWPTMGRSVIIGQEDVDTTFLVTPDTVARVKDKVWGVLDGGASEEVKGSVRRAVEDFAGGMEVWEGAEWCVVVMNDETMRTYCSFEGYLRAVEESSRVVEKDCWNLESGEFFGYALGG